MRREPGGDRGRLRAAWSGVVLALGLVLVGAACQKADPEAALKDRAAAYWQLKQSKGWPEVYDRYLDPEAKKTLTRDAFLKRRFLAFDILSYEITDVQGSPDRATVVVQNEANIPLKSPDGQLQFIKKHVTTKDEWVRRDGEWYVVLTE